MTTINNLSIEQMREAFERHQADLTSTDYEVLKAHFDNNEQYFGSRYNEGSLYERDWFVWEACWQSRHAEVDQLKCENKKIHGREIKKFEENLILKAGIEEKDKRIEAALAIVTKMAKATNSTAMWAYDLDKALRGEHE